MAKDPSNVAEQQQALETEISLLTIKEQRLRRLGKDAEADQCRQRVAQLQQQLSHTGGGGGGGAMGSAPASSAVYSVPPPPQSSINYSMPPQQAQSVWLRDAASTGLRPTVTLRTLPYKTCHFLPRMYSNGRHQSEGHVFHEHWLGRQLATCDTVCIRVNARSLVRYTWTKMCSLLD